MLLIILTLFLGYTQASVWDNLTVNLAVMEYQPISSNGDSAQARVLRNTIQYMEHVISLSTNKSFDLIVFPESALRTGTETAVEVAINTTCDTSANCPDPLQEMSFVARTYQTYIVINLVEKSKCEESDESSNCKNYGFRFYNADVVFDRSGKIINKYRKYNLFGERNMDKPETADEVIIRTDFGINFGIFTCFDILFKSPSQDLLSQDVGGVIFPTMWFSELPFLTAVQAQQMWAQRHDVLFLGSGANNPLVGSGGSGVYRGSKGAAVSGIVAEGGSQPFIYTSVAGEVPASQPQDTDTLAKQMDGFYLKREPSLDSYTSVILNTSSSVLQQEVCHDKLLCCNFNLKMSTSTPTEGKNVYTYHLIAYSGVRTFDGVYNGGIEHCAILACMDSSLASCGKRFPNYDEVEWPVTFENITVVANFEKTENKTQFPNSLLSSILPIEAEKTVWKQEETGNQITTTFSTTEKQDRLLTFGIFGRNFELDSEPSEKIVVDDSNAGGAWRVTWGLILGCLFFVAF